MTTDQDLTQGVRAFLQNGADRMPERVYERVMDVVPATRRQRSWSSPLARPPAAAFVRFAPAAALILAVALGAASLISNGGRVGIGPAPTASPTAAPTTTPPQSAEPSLGPAPSGGPVDGIPADTILGAGTYEVGAAFEFPFSITLPDETRFVGVGPGFAAFDTRDGTVEAYVPTAVYRDPCRVDPQPVPVSTPDQVVAALRSMRGFTATTPTSTTVAGHPARTFVLTNTIDTASAGCTRGLMLPVFTFLDGQDPGATNGGTRQVIWVVDVDARPLLIVGDAWQDGNRPDVQAIIGTMALR
jgi:hypothetical protein